MENTILSEALGSPCQLDQTHSKSIRSPLRELAARNRHANAPGSSKVINKVETAGLEVSRSAGSLPGADEQSDRDADRLRSVAPSEADADEYYDCRDRKDTASVGTLDSLDSPFGPIAKAAPSSPMEACSLLPLADILDASERGLPSGATPQGVLGLKPSTLGVHSPIPPPSAHPHTPREGTDETVDPSDGTPQPSLASPSQVSAAPSRPVTTRLPTSERPSGVGFSSAMKPTSTSPPHPQASLSLEFASAMPAADKLISSAVATDSSSKRWLEAPAPKAGDAESFEPHASITRGTTLRSQRPLTSVSETATAPAASSSGWELPLPSLEGEVGVALRRRRRVSGGLGMTELYGSKDNAPKYSQGEVDALLQGQISEQATLRERAEVELRVHFETQVAVLTQALDSAQTEAERLRREVRQCGDHEAVVAELSEQLRQFEESNVAKLGAAERELREKSVQLEAMTHQYLALKEENEDLRERHAREVAAALGESDCLRAAATAAEDEAIRLKAECDRIRDQEREKRVAAVLKMKENMTDLAQKQFAEANKQFRQVQARLRATSEELERVKGDMSRAREAQRGATDRAEEAQRQLDTARQDQALRDRERQGREDALHRELATLRAEAVLRGQQMDARAREQADAVKDRDMAQESLARMAVRNSELQREIAELKEVSNELMDMLEKQQAQA